MTGLNIRDESHMHESILFGFLVGSDNAIVINYSMLYAKDYIYFEKINENTNQNTLNIDFLGYLSKLKYILKIEKAYVFKIIKACDFLTQGNFPKCNKKY